MQGDDAYIEGVLAYCRKRNRRDRERMVRALDRRPDMFIWLFAGLCALTGTTIGAGGMVLALRVFG